MPRGSHYGRIRKRPYTVEYHRLSAIVFKPLLQAKLGRYTITLDHLSEQHKNFELIETAKKIKVAKFHIKSQTLHIALIQDDCSASNKLYITCPCCQSKRQHLYAVKNAYACRECLGLHYATQAERPRDRLMRKIRNKRKKLWGNDWPEVLNMFALSHYWAKPKGIHWKTFYKAKEEIYHLERKYWPMVEIHLNKQFGHLKI
ncbi:hypothetical protein [Psychromonas sp. Urea-02u-13]|uniref:hypothetical protein n=1 Tax=Psychromonas sp. Urea-02u-13 TaxID=2058326 RepID=UPI000C31EC59|nr:hypothetical protein [Psychromonas sp. Urea-02u-13]PKG39473.1 hypothetical protein CXF74_08570 [Psychromonas sp. Urea-02u-13]